MGKVKKLIVLLLILMIIGGATFGVLQYMEIGPFAIPESEKTEQKADEGFGEPPVFIDVEALLIPVFQGDRVISTIQISVKLELKKDNQEEVNRMLPKIHDALLRDLYTYIPRQLRRYKKLNLLKVKRHMITVTNRSIGEGLVDNILIQSIMDTPR